MAWEPEARRTVLGWKVDYLITAVSNQVINVFNTNALQNLNNYLKHLKKIVINKTHIKLNKFISAFHTAEVIKF